MNRSLFRGLPEVERRSDGQLYRMTPEQSKRASAMIRGGCCNYIDGLCLLMDVPCPQLLTPAVCCKVFRWAILEDPAHALFKTEIFRDSAAIKCCEVCGKPFVPKSNRAAYCPDCARKVRRQKDRERKRTPKGG